MPRKGKGGGRGGAREGAPGTAYGNRSDLSQAPSAAPGQTYGVQAQQLRAQAQAPLPKQAPPPAPAGSAAPAAPTTAGAPAVMPGSLGGLGDPTARPGEPITAGLTSGPGPGPEAIGLPGPPEDPTLATLKGILARYPNADLQALVAQASARHP